MENCLFRTCLNIPFWGLGRCFRGLSWVLLGASCVVSGHFMGAFVVALGCFVGLCGRPLGASLKCLLRTKNTYFPNGKINNLRKMHFWHLVLSLLLRFPALCLFAASLSLLGCIWYGLRVPVRASRTAKSIEKPVEIALFEPAKLYRFERLLGASDVLLGCLLGASWKLEHPHDALLISMDFIRFHQIPLDFIRF